MVELENNNMKGAIAVRKVQKHDKLYDDMLGIMDYIKGNTPQKKNEKTECIKDEGGNEKEIIYTVIDIKGVEHRFHITSEGSKLRLVYLSIGEYLEYIEDDLDLM